MRRSSNPLIETTQHRPLEMAEDDLEVECPTLADNRSQAQDYKIDRIALSNHERSIRFKSLHLSIVVLLLWIL